MCGARGSESRSLRFLLRLIVPCYCVPSAGAGELDGFLRWLDPRTSAACSRSNGRRASTQEVSSPKSARRHYSVGVRLRVEAVRSLFRAAVRGRTPAARGDPCATREGVEALERATASIERDVEVIESLATLVGPLTESVDRGPDTTQDLVQMLGPIPRWRTEMGRAEHGGAGGSIPRFPVSQDQPSREPGATEKGEGTMSRPGVEVNRGTDRGGTFGGSSYNGDLWSSRGDRRGSGLGGFVQGLARAIAVVMWF